MEGQLVDATTGQPVPYGQVTLHARSVGSSSGGYGTLEEHTADADGNFSFKFDASSGIDYKVDGYKINYYYGAHEDGETIKGGRRIKNLSVKLKPMAFVRYHIQDVDSLGYNGAGLNATLCNVSERNFTSQATDTSIVCSEFGNQEINIAWYRFEGGPAVKMYNMGIYLPAHDTTTVNINF